MSERQTCEFIENNALCGQPAVDYIDLDWGTGQKRLWVCAEHYDVIARAYQTGVYRKEDGVTIHK
jgi:2-keto-3-deoxy-galactonokinase